MERIIDFKNTLPMASPQFPVENEQKSLTVVGGTVYEVTSRFNPDGTETVLRQFMELLRDTKMI